MYESNDLIIEFRENWPVLREELKQKYADITDDDLNYEEGNEDELFGRLEKKTGFTRDQLLRKRK